MLIIDIIPWLLFLLGCLAIAITAVLVMRWVRNDPERPKAKVSPR